MLFFPFKKRKSIRFAPRSCDRVVVAYVQWPSGLKAIAPFLMLTVLNTRSPETPLVIFFYFMIQGVKTVKNLILTTALLTAAAIPAHAQEITLKPYVGLDLQRSIYSYKNMDLGSGASADGDKIFEDKIDGVNLHFGSRFHKYFGAELGYFRTREEDRNIGAGSSIESGTVLAADAKTKVQMQGVTVDALGYIPITKDEKLELIGTAGATWTKADIKLSQTGLGAESYDKSEWGLRGGAGAQYNFTENLNIRGLVRYQTADFDDSVDRAWTVSTGVNYTFYPTFPPKEAATHTRLLFLWQTSFMSVK